MAIKYAVFPGPVISKHDGTRHYVTSADLVRLYGVQYSECRIFLPQLAGRERVPEDLIQLRPRYDGDYRLPVAP